MDHGAILEMISSCKWHGNVLLSTKCNFGSLGTGLFMDEVAISDTEKFSIGVEANCPLKHPVKNIKNIALKYMYEHAHTVTNPV